jgi:hypothetical protein
VPEYDAFGREVGEDPLAQWRTAPQPARVAPQPAAPQPAAQPRRTRPRRRGMARLIILLALACVGFSLVGGVVEKVDDAIKDIEVPGAAPPAAVPSGLGPGSLLRPAAFERAMAQVREKDIGRVQSIRVAPDRILPTLLTPKGTLTVVQVDSAGRFQRFSESGTGFGHLDTIPYDRLDPQVPQRLTRAAAKRLGVPVTKIDYLVPGISDGKVSWGAYSKGGAIFMADERGRHLRRIS